MKIRHFALLLASLPLWACNPDNRGIKTELVPLSVDKTSVDFPAEGGEQTFTVTASEKVFAVPGDDWLTATAGAEDASHRRTVTLAAQENASREERTTRVSVVAGEEKIYVDVRQAAKASAAGPVPQDNAAWQVMNRLGMGWNLGNQLDAHNNGLAGETFWGNPKATQATFDKLKEAGYKSVRIPVTWLGKIGEAPDYRIDESWMSRVAEIVGYAESAGLNVIINIHHDGADSKYWLDIKSAALSAAENDEIIAEIKAVWGQIAEKFKDKGDFLIFESFNEIHDGGWGWGANRNDGGKQYKCLNEWNQAFVDAVRATGGGNASRYLAVPGYCTNIDLTVESFVMPEDAVADRLIVAVHYYDPSEYTLTAKYSEWGHTAAASKKAPGSDEDSVKEAFEKMYDKFIKAGIPVYIGEMGCANRATEREQAFQRYWFEYVVKAAKTYGMAPFVWDNGAEGAGSETHAFINHGTGKYASESARKAVETMTKAMNTEDEKYTLDSVYANAPK